MKDNQKWESFKIPPEKCIIATAEHEVKVKAGAKYTIYHDEEKGIFELYEMTYIGKLKRNS